MTPPPWVERALAGAVAVARTGPRDAAALADVLYSRWHAAFDAAPAAAGDPLPPGPPDLMELLHRAHAGSRRWERDWVVAATTPQAVLTVVRAGQMRRLSPPDYVNQVRPGVPPAPGEAVAVVDRDDWLDPSGWWASASARHGFPSGPCVRVYVSARATAAAETIAALTAALDGAGVPWGLKAPPRADGYGRRDAVVANVARTDWPRLAPALVTAHGELAPLLGPEGPPLAKPLLPGLSVAEDPGAGRSYGEVRCAQLADALLAGALAAPDPVAALARALEAAGVDPARPHLLDDAGAGDPYEL